MAEHSPLPWSVIPKKTDDFSDYLVVDANGDGVAAWPVKDGLEHIVRCVNRHKELVKLVEDFVGICEFAYDNGPEYDMDKSDGMKEVMRNGAALLAKAKGET